MPSFEKDSKRVTVTNASPHENRDHCPDQRTGLLSALERSLLTEELKAPVGHALSSYSEFNWTLDLTAVLFEVLYGS